MKLSQFVDLKATTVRTANTAATIKRPVDKFENPVTNYSPSSSNTFYFTGSFIFRKNEWIRAGFLDESAIAQENIRNTQHTLQELVADVIVFLGNKVRIIAEIDF